MDFVTSHFGKINPWPLLQHICPHFWAWLLNTIAITLKSENKYVVKVFNWSEVHLSEMTCYKIHTLATCFKVARRTRDDERSFSILKHRPSIFFSPSYVSTIGNEPFAYSLIKHIFNIKKKWMLTLRFGISWQRRTIVRRCERKKANALAKSTYVVSALKSLVHS